MIELALLRLWGLIKKVPTWVWVALAAAFIIWQWGNSRYQDGKSDEASYWEEKVETLRRERDAAMAVAQENDAAIEKGGSQAIEAQRRELDNATRKIPDQILSPRQRARACYELQKQGKRCRVDGVGSGPDPEGSGF